MGSPCIRIRSQRYRCIHGRIHGVPMNTLVCEYTNTAYQVSLVAGFGRSNMVMDYPQSRTDNMSSQSVVVLSMLIVILLTGRAIYVAISTDATLKGIFILIVYSSTLIFVGFIAGVNASNIRSRKSGKSHSHQTWNHHKQMSSSIQTLHNTIQQNSSSLNFYSNMMVNAGNRTS